MRLSANRDSPHYDREKALCVHVFCDGKFLPLVVEFDSDAGWADVIALDEHDKVIIESEGANGPARAKLARLHGKITYRDHTA